MIAKREPGDLFGRNSNNADGLAIALAIYVSASDSGVAWLATWAGDNQCKITLYRPMHAKLISSAGSPSTE